MDVVWALVLILIRLQNWAPAIKKLPADLIVVCHLLGTDSDPQNRQKTKKRATNKQELYIYHHSACEFVCKCLQVYRG